MTVSVSELRTILADMDRLEGLVANLVDGPLPFERVTEFNPTTSATFLQPDLGQQLATWRNTGLDFWMTRLGYTAWATEVVSENPGAQMADTGAGLATAANVALRPGFDFVWNMRRGTSQSYYANPTGGIGYLSRQALGNHRLGQPLTLSRPWKIAMGDTITFNIKPLGYKWTSSVELATASRFTVLMRMYGFRTGVR